MSFLLISGLGAGFTQTPGVLIVSLYFKKRRALASALVISGNSIGSFYMPPLIDYLLSEYRLRGTFLIIAALQLHISVASLLYRPIVEQAKVQARERAKLAAEESNKDESEKRLLQNGDAQKNLPSKHSFGSKGSSSLFLRVKSSKLLAEQEDSELTQQVSFLRSTSMMASVPDLAQYAKSWSVSVENNIHLTPPVQVITRVHTSSESEAPDNFLFKSNSGSHLMGAAQAGAVRRVNSSLGRMVLTKQAVSRLQPGSDLTTLVKKDINSSIRSIPNEPSIPEKDEDDASEDETSSNQNTEKDTSSKTQPDENPKAEEPPKTVSKLRTIFGALGSCFDMEVLRTRKMIIFTMSVDLMAVGAPHALIYLHAYSKSVGLDPSFVTKMLSISSMVDLVGRLTTGFIADRNIIPTAYIYLMR